MNEDKTAASADQIHLKLIIPSLSLGFVTAAFSWASMFGKIISRALQDKGIYTVLPPGPLSDAFATEPKPWFVMGCGNQAMGIFGVTNRLLGLQTLREELKALGLWECSQIAWFEIHEQVWMP